MQNKPSIVAVRKNKISAAKSKLTIGNAIIETKQISYEEWMLIAIRQKSKCYMLSYNKPDSRKLTIDNIISSLTLAGLMMEVRKPLNTSILFISSENLTKLQKTIHKNFPSLQFVLVRLNRLSFPKMNYCK